jgi:hypothetical protein
MTTSRFLASLRDPRRLAIRVQLTVLTGLLLAGLAGFMFVFFLSGIKKEALVSIRGGTESWRTWRRIAPLRLSTSMTRLL